MPRPDGCGRAAPLEDGPAKDMTALAQSRPAVLTRVDVNDVVPTPRIVVASAEQGGRPDPRCVMLHEPASAQARSYRLLRHKLLTGADPRIVAVTSAERGEGKTTCAINLALCIAEETLASVLLLEATSSRPSLTRAFGMARLHASRAEAVGEPARTLQHHALSLSWSRLHVGSASACSREGAGLDRLLLRVALDELRSAYDYVVVDTASVLESADADVVCECADGVLVATRAGTSRRGPLERALDQLRPATISGVVLLG